MMSKCPVCRDEPLITETSAQGDGSAYDMQGKLLVATATDTIITATCTNCGAVVDRYLESERTP